MEYRQASCVDIDALVTLRIAFLAEGFSDITPAQTQTIKDLLPAYFKRHLNKDLYVFLALEGNTIISTVFLQTVEMPMNPNFVTGKVGTILNVYTKPEYRKRGIAKALMELALSQAKKLGLNYVELQAMPAGLALYEKLGFTKKESKHTPMIYRLQN